MPTIFVTPGLIPLDAFTQFAVHAKPNSDNPIGHFGTGLKYAVAIILRHHGSFKMWVGETEYQFYTHETKFRGTDITSIRMRKRYGPLAKWRSTKLPFTVDLGKNWGLWQAYRELLSNTLDEGGQVGYGIGTCGDNFVRNNTTVIEIDCQGFREAQADVYLPHSLQDSGHIWDAPDHHVNGIQIWKRPSKFIYYKGIRVFELPTESWFTYNFSDGIILSEDRSLMNQYSVFQDIAKALDRMGFDDVAAPFLSDRQWFETHHLSFFGLEESRGTIRRVALEYGERGGYYLSSLSSSMKVDPADERHNFDVYLTGANIYEFVMSWQNGDVEDTEVVQKFKDWLVSENSSALQFIRDQAKMNDEQLPFDLEE